MQGEKDKTPEFLRISVFYIMKWRQCIAAAKADIVCVIHGAQTLAYTVVTFMETSPSRVKEKRQSIQSVEHFLKRKSSGSRVVSVDSLMTSSSSMSAGRNVMPVMPARVRSRRKQRPSRSRIEGGF